jgi:hypothetical protein
MARRYRAIHVALRVKDLRTLPGKSETHFHCHLLIRDLQQAHRTADLVLRHIAAVTLALSTIHTLHCSLLLICSGPRRKKKANFQTVLVPSFSLLYHLIFSLLAPPVLITLHSPLRLIFLIHFTSTLILLHMIPFYSSSSEPSPYLSSSDVSPSFL